MSERNTQIGILEWFPTGAYDLVDQTLASLEELGVRRLRTGVSWAEWHWDGAEEWFDWLFSRLTQANLEILPCFLYTPPSLGVVPRCSSPPRDPRDFAHFVDTILGRYGEHLEYVELWNEPNNQAEWDYTLDTHWFGFGEMIGGAAHWAKKLGKKVVLGGMSPIDPGWLELMFERGVMEYIDVVGVHGFPGTWEKSWISWDEHIQRVRSLLDERGSDAEIWITEVGYSTRNYREFEQMRVFADATDAPADRVYWYGMFDLEPDRPSVLGLHFDEREYHLGLKTHDGREKLLYRTWRDRGIDGVRAMVESPAVAHQPTIEDGVLVTGGCGFVGSNLVHRLLDEGRQVVVLDNLSRPNVEKNLAWLLEHPRADRLRFVAGDVRDRIAVRDALRGVSQVFHLAGQVAVTTSLDHPREDFTVNALGTLNLLEEMRAMEKAPSLVFTSTNKVYGGLYNIAFTERETRYEPEDERLRICGIDETQPLDFRSPYGCSKGAADQYVLDWARTYDIQATVLRMSCIYGPRQFGTEDQGWVAHFAIQTLDDEPITIFGDGKQVRDVLFVDDLIDAFLLAQRHMDSVSGRAFNIGGGPRSTLSLLELIGLLEQMHGASPSVGFDEWRPGDQRYYVSDTRAFRDATGWAPGVDAEEGVRRLYAWLCDFKRDDARDQRSLATHKPQQATGAA